MAAKKPRVVIIGAGMAGITAANRIHTAAPGEFELAVVEGGDRIGGRIRTVEFGGDRIEMGATWIHGIGGSPVHAIAAGIGALDSDRPWECMDGDPDRLVTVAEGGFVPDRSLVDPVASLFKSLMSFAENKPADHSPGDNNNNGIPEKAYESLKSDAERGVLSVGAFLRKGLALHWNDSGEADEILGGDWTRKGLEEGVFEALENNQRTYTSAGDLNALDYAAESEYRMCSGEEITIARGYSSVVHHLASALPAGLVQLGKKVDAVEWGTKNGFVGGGGFSPVKIRFSDGSSAEADHVVVTVSLGVLKAGVRGDPRGLRFIPSLPGSKAEAINRLGFGVVNKLFVKVGGGVKFPFLQMVFEKNKKKMKKKKKKIPWWMRKTASMLPIYEGSSVVLSWLAGDEALELESLGDEEVVEGVSDTIAAFIEEEEASNNNVRVVEEVLKSHWGKDPLFMGSYTYVAVGSSGDDFDTMAQPLPLPTSSSNPPLLQILFAGEATHRTHYSTTHGAYFSGLREANRLLKHYNSLPLL